MEKNNILSVLSQLLSENYFPCEWSLSWQEPNIYFEVILRLSLPNGEGYQIKGDQQVVWTDPFIYELPLLFYESDGLVIRGKPYLQTFPVHKTSGIPYGELLTIVRYLKQLVLDAKLAWKESYEQAAPFHFSPSWHNERFEAVRRSLIDSARYSEAKVFFPAK